MILLTGTIDVDPAQRDTFIAAAQAVHAATRAEAGCEHYSFSADIDDPGRFHLSERWADQAALDAHMATPHMAEFMGSLAGVVKAGDITKWTGATGEKFM